MMKKRLNILFSALDAFLFEKNIETHKGPHIRDFVDIKRWMILVVFALLPCLLMGILNSGVQQFVYSANDLSLIQSYMAASTSFQGYFSFVFHEGHFPIILYNGLKIVLPLLIISYGVGGFWEALFAVCRGHEISEGFLVTGMLYALILPSTIPYWMAALGISFAIVVGKELFGGTGMNVLNPALTGRCFLFFTFPAQMTGSIWVGNEALPIADNIVHINQTIEEPRIDGISQTSALSYVNIGESVKRIHVDTLLAYLDKDDGKLPPRSVHRLSKWQEERDVYIPFDRVDPHMIEEFITAPLPDGGLGLSQDNYPALVHFVKVKKGEGRWSDANLFFGNMIGSIGETSTAACILGALLLLFTGIASFRTMFGVLIGAYVTALLFSLGSHWIGPEHGIWNPAKFDFPAYKHLLLGGLAFGLVFMATDPVSSPSRNGAIWAYGLLIGFMVIFIRLINPAFPEGVMLAILFGNVFAPLFDHIALKRHIKRNSCLET